MDQSVGQVSMVDKNVQMLLVIVNMGAESWSPKFLNVQVKIFPNWARSENQQTSLLL